jgi:3-(3-hydroxy-phenyl)propionate hydroxylase
MSEPDYDVVVAGYGPTGLAAASLLASRGHRVAVFERWPTLYGQPRMATIDGESARIIQAAGNIDDALANSVARPRYLLANGAGQVLIDHDWDREHVCGFPYRISLHQPDIEDAMDAAARARGAEVNQGWELVGLEQASDHVTVTARERSGGDDPIWGEDRSVRARYVIGADGARSAVRELLGVARESWPFRNAWWSIDATRKRTLPDFWDLSPDGRVAVIFCEPEGRAHSIIPLGTNHLRINFQVDPDADHSDKLNREAAYRQVEAVYGLTEDDVDVYRWAIYPFEGKLAETFRVGRVFLAGDAAHLMTPFQGQGGCSALRDAVNLAWKLDLALRGIAGDELLDTYDAERRPHVRAHIDTSDRIGAFVFMEDAAEAGERDRLYLDGQAPPLPPDPILESGILRGNAAPIGGVGPQGVIRLDGVEGRFDDLCGWGFELIVWGRDPAEELGPERLAFLEQVGGVAVGVDSEERPGVAVDVGGNYRRFLDEHGVEAVLLRPDFVVFGVARSAAEVPELVDDLRAQLTAGA